MVFALAGAPRIAVGPPRDAFVPAISAGHDRHSGGFRDTRRNDVSDADEASSDLSTLLVVDGDSLAHRAYHALPKSIRGAGGRPANALVGFGNFLHRLWEAERPGGGFVGWDTLDVPTYRHEALPGYQSGREFDQALLEQLDALPELVASFGFSYGKAA